MVMSWSRLSDFAFLKEEQIYCGAKKNISRAYISIIAIMLHSIVNITYLRIVTKVVSSLGSTSQWRRRPTVLSWG